MYHSLKCYGVVKTEVKFHRNISMSTWSPIRVGGYFYRGTLQTTWHSVWALRYFWHTVLDIVVTIVFYGKRRRLWNYECFILISETNSTKSDFSYYTFFLISNSFSIRASSCYQNAQNELDIRPKQKSSFIQFSVCTYTPAIKVTGAYKKACIWCYFCRWLSGPYRVETTFRVFGWGKRRALWSPIYR